MKNNLFVFGCSYTNYKKPTYADFMSPYFDVVYNSGSPGSGNRSIFNRIHYFISNNLIKENDTVIVQWSSIPREDRILNNSDNNWVNVGLITNNEIYDMDWVNKWFNPYQTTLELLSYIQSINFLIKSITKNFKWFYLHEPWVDDSLGETGIPAFDTSKLDFIKKTGILNKIKSMSVNDFDYLNSIEYFYSKSMEKINNYGTYIYDENLLIAPDTHPNPYVHYRFSKKILKHINIELANDGVISENAKQWADYSSNKHKMYEFELNYYKQFGTQIDYQNNSNFYIKWPSNNIIYNIECNNIYKNI
jgi:hypothetical protein